MYEVHLSDTTGFLPGSNTLIGETPGNFFFARTVGAGLGGGPLVYGTTYYVKIRPKDADGTANPGPQASGFTVQATTPDLAVGSITAASAIIADAAIGTAKIQDAAIVTAKIADAQISSAKIQDLAVGTAKIADAAIVTAKIGDAQITSAKIVSLSADKITAGTIAAQEIIMSNSVASILRSSNFSAGSAGWRVRGSGDAEFNNVTVRGTVDASTILGSIFKTANSGTTADPVIWIGDTVTGSERKFIYFVTGASTSGAGYIQMYTNSFEIHAPGAGSVTMIASTSLGTITAQNAVYNSSGYQVNGVVVLNSSGGADFFADLKVRASAGGTIRFSASTAGAVSAVNITTTSFGDFDSVRISGTTVITGSGGMNYYGDIGPGAGSPAIVINRTTSDTGLPIVRSAFGILCATTSTEQAKLILNGKPARSPLMQLQVKTWRSRLHPGDLGGSDNPNRDIIGLVAEEVAAIDERLASYDLEGKPVAVAESVLSFFMLMEFQQLRKDVDAIQAQLQGRVT
jgi:hypothetical protein